MSVLLETSVGEIVIDLFTEECPKTALNYLKLCKAKYYNNCIFHNVERDMMAQCGDPTSTGKGGESVFGLMNGPEHRFFDDEIKEELRHDRQGIVAMASAGPNLNASQFYIVTREGGVDYLDGKHTVFGEVAEGLDVLNKINEAFCDDAGRPYRNIRIKHVIVLDDPFDDPVGLEKILPEGSPPLPEVRDRPDADEEDEFAGMTEEQKAKAIATSEAKSRAVVLEMVGDLPDAEIAPPDHVLFVCKLNPVTQDEDLELIFSRFGAVKKAEVIRDYKTGDSLNYAFIEFETKEACEMAYEKMNNVSIDDRRIKVDFSQSVAKEWKNYKLQQRERAQQYRREAANATAVSLGTGLELATHSKAKHDRYDLIVDGPGGRKGPKGGGKGGDVFDRRRRSRSPPTGRQGERSGENRRRWDDSGSRGGLSRNRDMGRGHGSSAGRDDRYRQDRRWSGRADGRRNWDDRDGRDSYDRRHSDKGNRDRR